MIKLIKSTFYHERETKKRLIEFIKSAQYLSFGQECELFEKNFAKFQNKRHCIFLNSGSSANLAIVQAMLNLNKIKQGDLVAFSALTWSTNVMPIIQLGLHAVPVDVELDTLNVSSSKLLSILTKYPIKMVFLTNLLGLCHDIDKIQQICEDRKIILLEDNCEALGSVYKKKKLGNYSLASTFSFYVGHHLSTIEGGAICTDSEQLATMLRIVRAHGWDRNLGLKSQLKIRNKFKVNSTFYSRYTFYELGYNLRSSEINGYLGNIQLSFIDEIIKKRNKNFLYLASEIYKKNKKYYQLVYNHMDLFSNFAIPLICRSVRIRDELVKKCANRIEIRPIVGGDITKQPFFRKQMPIFSNILGSSNAKLIHEQGLYFGNNPELTQKEMDTIIKIFTL